MTYAYRPPSTASDDVDLEALRVPMIVKAAAATCMLTGAFTLGLAIQTSIVFRVQGLLVLVVGTMAMLGIGTLVVGFMGLRAKFVATLLGTIGSALVALLGTIWAVVSLGSGVISPLSVWIILFAIASTIVCALALGPSRKISAARAALAARGFEFGI